jgi:hypothetical protein
MAGLFFAVLRRVPAIDSPHAENRVIRGSIYHERCRDRLERAPGTATVTFS